jgi:hypothetical protein
MKDTTYNGWRNYETWRVNLEIFDHLSAADFDGTDDGSPDIQRIAQNLKDYAIDLLALDCNDQSIAYSYALAFLDAADFRQIAQAMVETHIQNAKGN